MQKVINSVEKNHLFILIFVKVSVKMLGIKNKKKLSLGFNGFMKGI